MAADDGNGAFIKGFILGGLAGTGAMIWNAPQPGVRTREQIQERVEGVLLKLLDMPQALRGQDGPEVPVVVATEPVTATDMLIPPSLGETAVVPPPLAETGGADIVIDGPRPADLPR